jgi:hypothetical protein
MSRGMSRIVDIFEVITVGFPFCGFKILSGLVMRWSFEGPTGRFFALLLIGLGVIDLLINALNLLGLVVLNRRVLRACLFDIFMHPDWTWPDLGNSLDVLLSFTLVALVIGKGMLRQMTPEQLSTWDICVIFNVIGAGLSRLGSSLKSRR